MYCSVTGRGESADPAAAAMLLCQQQIQEQDANGSRTCGSIFLSTLTAMSHSVFSELSMFLCARAEQPNNMRARAGSNLAQQLFL